jgi:hypothetical protein
MPDLYYVDEKRHVFKSYNFNLKQIIAEKIDLNPTKIPMFTGIGSVNSRIFLFGGKENETKLITNKAYELVMNEELLLLKPINRMIKNRSRSAIASMTSNFGRIKPFLVIIGGSDQFQSLH